MMRLLTILTVSLTLISCASEQKSPTPPSGQYYGEEFSLKSTKDIKEIETLMQGKDSLLLTVEGPINKTCAMKGCWMQIEGKDSSLLRVKFKDYAFFVPKSGVEGKTAAFKGYCQKTVTSIEELKHYAMDAGDSEESIAAIVSPKEEYNFIATGVFIEND